MHLRPAHSRTVARAIFLTLGLGILGVSLMLNGYLLLTGVLLGGSRGGQSTTLVSGKPDQQVAVLPLGGIIDGASVEQFERLLRRIEDDKRVKALVIQIDSPGGEVTASDQLHHLLLGYRQRTGVPIVVQMGALAASGGYYIACAGDHLIAQPTTLTGNIGVVMPRYNVHELLERWGIRETTIVSTGSPFKNAGSMFKPEQAEETAYWQGLADEAFAQFKRIIAQSRGGKLNGSMDSIASGKAFMATEARRLGLIDQVGYPHDAYAKAAELAGLDDMTVIVYRPQPSLFELLGVRSAPATPSSTGVTINGVNVAIDGRTLQDLMTPRLLYLMSP
jgi:protease-4